MGRLNIVRKQSGGKGRTWPGTLGLALTSLLFIFGAVLYAAVGWMDRTLRIQFGELLYSAYTPAAPR